MRLAVALIAILLLPAPAAAQSGPRIQRALPVEPPPELAGHLNPRDRWATLALDVDTAGRVTACRVVRTNEANSERRAMMCRAFLYNFQVRSIMENGVAVARTIHRNLVIPGLPPREPRRRRSG
jgi:hypothetical protein